MAERNLDLSSLAKHYKGKWIIVSKDGCSVLCAAETLEDAIQGSKTYDGVLLKIPAFVKSMNGREYDTPQLYRAHQ